MKVVPTAKPDTGPVAQKLLKDPPLLLPDVEFPNLPHFSTSPIEQEMLDHGTLTSKDLDIITFGNALPNLGPNFHSPDDLT